MSFDPRSLERLRQLGRTLPQPLPAPPAAPAAEKSRPNLHKVETETDPEALFRELMQASADGTVPPHLLDRLRQLEAQRPSPPPAATPAAGQAAAAPPRPRGQTSQGRPDPRLAREHGDLYTAFQQLLLEDEEL